MQHISNVFLMRKKTFCKSKSVITVVYLNFSLNDLNVGVMFYCMNVKWVNLLIVKQSI